MKVLDLQCTVGHVFEGWFGSEADFLEQSRKLLVQCPLCGDPAVSKKLSAPRLALSKSRLEPKERGGAGDVAPTASDISSTVWLAVARKLVAETTDVGSSFAEEARKMHYGETEHRNIRGQASPQETEALLDEGISVLPLPMPELLKETLQ